MAEILVRRVVPGLALGLVLALPGRAAAIDAIFSDGYDDRACAWSAAVVEGAACGPGHLVLIGHDYSELVVQRRAPAPDSVAVTGLEQVLVNAVAQSRATQLARPTRVSLVDADATSAELGHVTEVLGAAFALETQSVAPDGVPSALAASDVLLVLDQNGAFADADATIATQLAPSLRRFVETGGVVVVLDGTYFDGDVSAPSETYRVLDPRLLAVDDADGFQGCAQPSCNGADPLLGGVAGETCQIGNAVTFATDEPWVALVHRDLEDVDRPFVLHKWFGTTEEGPIGYDLDDANPGADLSGLSVFFQDASGQQVAQCRTLGNGTAVHQMGPDSFVSLGVNSGSRQLVTVIGAQPLDHLEQRPPPGQPGGEEFLVVASLPGEVPGTDLYRVMVGCGSLSSGDLLIEVATPTGCANPDGSFSVVAEALDQDGEILAYSIRHGVTEVSPQPIELPDWQQPDLLPFTTGVSGVRTVELGVRLRARGGVDYVEGGEPVLRGGNGGTYSFYSGPGSGGPKFEQLSYRARIRFFEDGQPFRVISERSVRGPMLDELPISGSEFLPRITESSTDYDENGRFGIVWVPAGAVPGMDGGAAQLSWSRGFVFYQWLIVFPPGTSLLAPPNPGGDGDMFWPVGGEDVVALSWLRLDDATFAPSYRAYRQDVLGVLQPPGSDHVLRSTQLAPAN